MHLNILDLVVPGDITNSMNVSTEGLPLVIERTTQVGTVKAIFDCNPSQATPLLRQRFEFRLVPSGRPIDKTKRDVCGNYMKTDCMISHMSCFILKSSGRDNDNAEVQKLGKPMERITTCVQLTFSCSNSLPMSQFY